MAVNTIDKLQILSFLGVCSSLLSTDAHCLVIKLDGQCDMVDFM